MVLSLFENNIPILLDLDLSLFNTNDTNDIDGIDGTYQYLGLIYKALKELNKNKTITIYFNLLKLPFVFLLVLIKIKLSTGTKFKIFIKDEDTLKFIEDFINSDPKKNKEFFTKSKKVNNSYSNSDLFKDKKTTEEKDPSKCEISMAEKFKELKEQLDQDTNVKNFKELLLKDSEEASDEKMETIKRNLEIINNLSENSFVDLMENNFTNELKKLPIELF
jgi:hypothetical protein